MTVKKHRGILFSIGFLLFFAVSVWAQDTFNAVSQAVESGNARELSHWFDKRVLVNIEGSSNQYSAAQAEIIVRDFFNQHPSKGFTVLSSGATDMGNAEFIVGKLLTNKGNYRTYIYIRRSGNQMLIQEIRFEKI